MSCAPRSSGLLFPLYAGEAWAPTQRYPGGAAAQPLLAPAPASPVSRYVPVRFPEGKPLPGALAEVLSRP